MDTEEQPLAVITPEENLSHHQTHLQVRCHDGTIQSIHSSQSLIHLWNSVMTDFHCTLWRQLQTHYWGNEEELIKSRWSKQTGLLTLSKASVMDWWNDKQEEMDSEIKRKTGSCTAPLHFIFTWMFWQASITDAPSAGGMMVNWHNYPLRNHMTKRAGGDFSSEAAV